jgi:hypothetical protein
MTLNSIKEEVIQLIKDLPDEATLEDIQYHLFVKQKLLRAEEQIKEGNTIPHEKVMEKTQKEMVQIEWSEEAEDDLDDILSYLSKSSIQYAESFFQGINEAIENIAKFPKIGRKVPESKYSNYKKELTMTI